MIIPRAIRPEPISVPAVPQPPISHHLVSRNHQLGSAGMIPQIMPAVMISPDAATEAQIGERPIGEHKKGDVMGRCGRVGVFRQVAHPRIRGALDPSHEQRHVSKVARLEDYKADEETYFVPSFSIRRHLHRDEGLLWETQQQLVGRRLGKGFTATPADRITLKVLEQQKLIRNMREAGIRPDPDEIRDIAYSIRDGLTNLLFNAHSPLNVPLGDFGKAGYRGESVAYEIMGWRGERANYGPNDNEGFMSTHAALLAERQLVVGALSYAYGEAGLNTDNLASSPHITVARANQEIPDYRVRSIRGELGDLAISAAAFGDPVIEVKMYPDMPAEPIYVKHAWDSLALHDMSA
jgi:hypothetical protein